MSDIGVSRDSTKRTANVDMSTLGETRHICAHTFNTFYTLRHVQHRVRAGEKAKAREGKRKTAQMISWCGQARGQKLGKKKEGKV